MGFGEAIFILAFTLILFGPDDLPQIARTFGRIVSEIRNYTGDINREFQNAFNEPINNSNNETAKTDVQLTQVETNNLDDATENDVNDVNDEIEEISSTNIFDLIITICSNAAGSSISYDLILNSTEFKRIVSLDNKALQEMLLHFQKTKSDGLEEYIMAMACSEIVDENIESNFVSGREWFNQYQKNQ